MNHFSIPSKLINMNHMILQDTSQVTWSDQFLCLTIWSSLDWNMTLLDRLKIVHLSNLHQPNINTNATPNHLQESSCSLMKWRSTTHTRGASGQCTECSSRITKCIRPMHRTHQSKSIYKTQSGQEPTPKQYTYPWCIRPVRQGYNKPFQRILPELHKCRSSYLQQIYKLRDHFKHAAL
uniref:Uncharacterized protein n=1 Tax=Megaselia scalaris TaxID=36166 RepID=T1GMX5_MEGSC